MSGYWQHANCTCPIAPIEWNMGMWISSCRIFQSVLGQAWQQGIMYQCGSESRNLLSYSHIYIKIIPTLYSTSTWFSLWDQSIMCLFGFLHFNGVCGFHIYRFLVDFMFLSCSNIKSMFFCRSHVSHHGICFYIKAMFIYQVFVFVLSQSFRLRGCFS